MTNLVIEQYQTKLHDFYHHINKQKTDQITKQQLSEWLNIVFNDQQISTQKDVKQLQKQFDQGFQFWVDTYLREVCNLESQNIQNLQFKENQCIEFLSWLLNTQIDKQEQQAGEQQNKQMQKSKQISNNGSNVLQNKSNHKTIQKSAQKQSPSPKIHKQKTNNNSQLIDRKTKQIKEQTNQFSQALINSQPVQKIKDFLVSKDLNQNTQQQLKLSEQDERYRQYLQTIFEHYCKINFGLAKDNTFESMQKNVSLITMNKFMIFCNDFQINVLIAASLPKQSKQKNSKLYVRNLLMQIFKKNSQFHKQMKLEQFFQAIQKIGQTSFARLKQNQQTSDKSIKATKFSFQMIKMIKYMQISNFKEFKDKMNKFNINFSLKFNKQLQQKKFPINYKFKFESEQNKRSQTALNSKLPIQKRKTVLKQGQQNINKPKVYLQMAKPPLSNKMSTPNMSLGNHNLGVVRQKKILSNKNVSSHQKLNSLPNNRADRNIIVFEKPTNKTGSRQSLQKLSTHQPSYQQSVIEGYANIHLAKKGLLLDSGKNSQSGIRKKGQFQLNNVIEQARKQTNPLNPKIHYDYSDSRSGRAMSNISVSKPLSQYSRDPVSNQSYRNSRQDQELDLNHYQGSYRQPHKQYNNQQFQQAVQMKNSRLNVKSQLQNLIDFNDSDDDQYLDQHLKKQKQKQNDTQITIRMQKKINSLSYQN